MRVDYAGEGLDVDALAGTWHEQLAEWLAEAEEAGLPEVNAMVLATAGDDGRPSSRTVLCKGLDERGVVFYTNYTSAKSHDLRVTRYASATFPWYAQHRQVHLRGPVELVPPEETQAYWASRPAGRAAGGVGVGAVDGGARPPGARRRAGRRHPAVRRRRAGAGAGRTGAAGGSSPSRWSSGRAGPTGCTTGCASSLDPHDRSWTVRRLAP